MKTDSQPILKLGPNSNGQILFFFGARHTNNPDDEQFKQLEVLFGDFQSRAGQQKIILVEGATREIPAEYCDAIKMYGEAGAINWLARKMDTGILRPEPNEEDQRKRLCDTFEPSLVAYTIITQNLSGWSRGIRQTTFSEAVDKALARETKYSDIYKFSPDILWLKEQHKKLFNEQQLEDKMFLDSITDPRKDISIVNKVVAARSKLRNDHILSVISEFWISGKSIFIVYGKGHLEPLSEAIKGIIHQG